MKTRNYSYETAVQIAESLPTDEQVRRWGWEIESPIVGEVKSRLRWTDYDGLSFCSDGSLSGSDCDCDCSDCYHSCDCDNCDRSDYLDHCGDCGTNEVCSESPMTTPRLTRWHNFLAELEARWVPVENYRENWGGHLHIEGRDLGKRNAVNLVLVGVRMFELSPEWFTGGDDNYNSAPRREELFSWQVSDRGGMVTNRASWISIHNLPAQAEPYQVGDEYDFRKTTVEFRRFRSTPDRQLIEFRRLVCQKLIEYVQKNKSTYWLMRCPTFDEFLTELGV